MANLKEVRSRITSVNSTQQITKAMKMVAAAKLRRAQDAIIQMRPYASKLKEILESVAESVDRAGNGVYAHARPVNKVLIIAVTSNRGLAGAFNSNIIRTINRLLAGKYQSYVKEGNIKILAIGKKASDSFSKTPELYAGEYNDVYVNLDFESVSSIAEDVMELFANGDYDEVHVVYNRFKNAAVQNVVTEQVIPIAQPDKAESGSVNDYIFEPSQAQIVLELIPKAIKVQIYKAVLDSHASEHGARMTAMSMATDNAGELLKELRLQYNKARQAAITNEILEIVSGAEALKG
jgi:F-type H+-transporting ATPase subunit gamma